MSFTRQELLNANNPIAALTTELDSLASNGVVLSATVVSNVQGDSAGLGYPELLGKLALGSAAFGVNAAVFGWLLQANDGTNYETYISTSPSTTPPCSRLPDFVWSIDNATQAQIRDAWAAAGAPICAKQKLLIWNNTGVALAATGNSLNFYFGTSQLN